MQTILIDWHFFFINQYEYVVQDFEINIDC